jgi:hypothetical protein
VEPPGEPGEIEIRAGQRVVARLGAAHVVAATGDHRPRRQQGQSVKAKRAADVPLPVNDLQRLHVEVSKAEKTVAFVFEGLHITVRRKGIAVSIVIDFVLEIGNGVYVLSPITRAADDWLVAHLPPNALVRDRYVVVPRMDIDAITAALAEAGLRVVRTT